jgi:hypothetical protein
MLYALTGTIIPFALFQTLSPAIIMKKTARVANYQKTFTTLAEKLW